MTATCSPPLPFFLGHFSLPAAFAPCRCEEQQDDEVVRTYSILVGSMLEEEETTLYVDFEQVMAYSEQLASTIQQEHYR